MTFNRIRFAAIATAASVALLGACSNSVEPGGPTRFHPGPIRTPVQARPDAHLRAWEVPASQIATSPRSADWSRRIWENADLYDDVWTVEFGFDKASNDYSIPVYSTADATTTARVYHRTPVMWNGRFDIDPGDKIPWNPAWLPSDGNDAFMVIVDPQTGQEWDIWAVSSPWFNVEYMQQLECLGQWSPSGRVFDPTVDLCAAAVMVIRQPDGAIANVNTYRGNYPVAGGLGIQNTAGLVTPEEVRSGEIRHALRFAVSGDLAMTGPVCPPDVTSPDDPRIGTTCGVSLAPAGQFDRRAKTSTPEQLAGMVPRGTRIVIDKTDAEIEAWLDSRGYTGALRNTARIFAVALRDYGLIQSDTTGGPAFIQAAGARNPETAAGWRELGIDEDDSRLLEGLITPDSIRVLEPATNHCATGPSRFACWASDITYP
jgi:hypothetical protein